MNNEQRAKEAAKKVMDTLLKAGSMWSEERLVPFFLDALNAATKEKDTRIKALNDALKPFAEMHYKIREYEKRFEKTCSFININKKSKEHFRTAAAVIEEG